MSLADWDLHSDRNEFLRTKLLIVSLADWDLHSDRNDRYTEPHIVIEFSRLGFAL